MSVSVKSQITPLKTAKHAPKTSAKFFSAVNRPQVVAALVNLGYPISRYIQAHPLPEKLQRIFVRARQSYYQNHVEFGVLKGLLGAQLSAQPDHVLAQMVQQAHPFVPMWQGQVQGSAIVKSLDGFFC